MPPLNMKTLPSIKHSKFSPRLTIMSMNVRHYKMVHIHLTHITFPKNEWMTCTFLHRKSLIPTFDEGGAFFPPFQCNGIHILYDNNNTKWTRRYKKQSHPLYNFPLRLESLTHG